MTIRIQCVAVDANDPAALARFWREVLGWRLTDEAVLEPPEGSPEDGVSPDLIFLRVPEAKQAKGRLHLDLRPEDQQAEVDRVIALGATRTDVGQSDDETWVVLADPEGNEFCILRALRTDEQ
ncbi:MAG: VOC family protein [Streptosporangiales bacterium]